MKARTISTERYLSTMIRFTSVLQWLDSRRDRAEAEGINKDAAAAIEVNKNADLDLVYAAVYKTGSKPQRVCARF